MNTQAHYAGPRLAVMLLPCHDPTGSQNAMSFRKSDLHLLVFGIAAIVFFAIGAGRAFRASYDFVPVYTGARCLLYGCNPYDTKQLEQQFFAGSGRPTELPSWEIDMPVYPPSTFLTLSPKALLRFPVARLLWFLLNGCLFVTSAGLILSLCTGPHRWLATTLASFILLPAEFCCAWTARQLFYFAGHNRRLISWLVTALRLLGLCCLCLAWLSSPRSVVLSWCIF